VKDFLHCPVHRGDWLVFEGTKPLQIANGLISWAQVATINAFFAVIVGFL
jgi:hypothetical protein